MSNSDPLCHVAGAPIDLVQSCSRCYAILSDQRGAMYQITPENPTPKPAWWPTGGHVLVEGNSYSMATVAEAQAFACDRGQAS